MSAFIRIVSLSVIYPESLFQFHCFHIFPREVNKMFVLHNIHRTLNQPLSCIVADVMFIKAPVRIQTWVNHLVNLVADGRKSS